jgi:hypothetical protein
VVSNEEEFPHMCMHEDQVVKEACGRGGPRLNEDVIQPRATTLSINDPKLVHLRSFKMKCIGGQVFILEG